MFAKKQFLKLLALPLFAAPLYAFAARLESASQINDAGQILVWACTSDFNCRDVLLDPISAVPEPASAAMLLAGLGALALRGRRRCRAAAGPHAQAAHA